MTTVKQTRVKAHVEPRPIEVEAAFATLEAEIAANKEKLAGQRREADESGKYFRNPSPECN